MSELMALAGWLAGPMATATRPGCTAPAGAGHAACGTGTAVKACGIVAAAGSKAPWDAAPSANDVNGPGAALGNMPPEVAASGGAMQDTMLWTTGPLVCGAVPGSSMATGADRQPGESGGAPLAGAGMATKPVGTLLGVAAGAEAPSGGAAPAGMEAKPVGTAPAGAATRPACMLPGSGAQTVATGIAKFAGTEVAAKATAGICAGWPAAAGKSGAAQFVPPMAPAATGCHTGGESKPENTWRSFAAGEPSSAESTS
eukprot:CAMPEP_0170268374 /NCGR_PEP_ID=MMETSP0116_2-20130129/34117_1 /TAXON_ID=400756 /ORGANISM="Durinskia baltica, Strain CSIRO CS-38" /LENGTH=256 /DNA_ID=CAMNT_0010519537 /DNA_START=176 /DNA_END=945 /DNA_ORIENTATION=+